jgi:hypothetical protein
MKIIAMIILLFANSAWANSVLTIGATQPEQFRASIDLENPLQLSIVKGNEKTVKNIKFANTISDIQKFAVHLMQNDGAQKSIEMLLVVTSVGNAEQDVKVFAPERRSDMIISSQIDPLCTLKNYGDFSWEGPADIQERLRLVEKDNVATIQLKVKSTDNSQAIVQWKNCGSIRLAKNQ